MAVPYEHPEPPSSGYAFPSDIRYDREVGFSKYQNPGMSQLSWHVGKIQISWESAEAIVRVGDGIPQPTVEQIIAKIIELRFLIGTAILAEIVEREE